MTKGVGPDPRSGVQVDGSFVPAFEGQRPPFQPGHELSVRHGAYATSLLERTGRVMELVEEFRLQAPWLSSADEPALRACALAAARFEAAAGVLVEWDARQEGESLETHFKRLEASRTLSRDARGWMNTFLHLADQLGLTPRGRLAFEERQGSTISVEEATAFVTACFEFALEFVDASRHEQFLDGTQRIVASLPSADTDDR